MYMDQTGYLGMHFVWWIFWVLIWVSFFSFLTPVRKTHLKKLRENPKDILQRRFANGEISQQEYATTKEILDRDSGQVVSELNSARGFPNRPIRT